ncbi:MAG: T9SS type A sorting domain-containing protein [Bacteroidales bacterium]|jgi:hypothetical protein|nr:T9SS type A sorting domain-containing protein [Bacteroidales bacterium]
MRNKLRIIAYTIFVVSLLPCSQVLHAQINLEHTFEGYASYYGSNIGSYGDINMFILSDPEANQVKLYNEDYSLYKAITITPPNGYKISSTILYCTRKLFNANDKIEFIVHFTQSSVDADNNNNDYMRIYDEDGNVIKDFGNAYTWSPSIIKLSNGQFKLRISKYIYNTSNPNTCKTEIYSLPGSMSVKAIEVKEDGIEYPSPYPNPSNSIVHLPYQLKKGETSIMRIYNLQGQLLEQKQIDYSFHEILLDVSEYAKGVYIYEVNGISNRFIVE